MEQIKEEEEEAPQLGEQEETKEKTQRPESVRDINAENAEQCCVKADCAFYGHGEPQSYEKAFNTYQQAASSGSARAYACLARMYEAGIYVEQSLVEAFEFYKKGADLGDSTSMFALGKYYEKGMVPDYVEPKGIEVAVEYYTKASVLDNHEAITKLGYMHENGIFFEQDKEKAHALYQKAADLGNALAKNFVGLYQYNRGNYKPAVELFKRSKELGCARAANNLGMCYEQGLGTERDLDRALECYQEAAEKGHASGMYNLAYLYLRKAKSTKQTAQFAKAAYWFRAALSEDPKMADALFYTGFLYEKGLGVDRDFHTAYSYYLKASGLGHARASKRCGDLLYSGCGLLRADKPEAFNYYLKASKLGDADAYNSLGLLYEKGYEGADKDPGKAFDCYTTAAKNGCVEAEINLAWMYLNGIYVRKSVEQANELMKRAAEKGNTAAREYLVANGIVPSIQNVKKADADSPENKQSVELLGNSTNKELSMNVAAPYFSEHDTKVVSNIQLKSATPAKASPERQAEEVVIKDEKMESARRSAESKVQRESNNPSPSGVTTEIEKIYGDVGKVSAASNKDKPSVVQDAGEIARAEAEVQHHEEPLPQADVDADDHGEVKKEGSEANVDVPEKKEPSEAVDPFMDDKKKNASEAHDISGANADIDAKHEDFDSFRDKDSDLNVQEVAPQREPDNKPSPNASVGKANHKEGEAPAVQEPRKEAEQNKENSLNNTEKFDLGDIDNSAFEAKKEEDPSVQFQLA